MKVDLDNYVAYTLKDCNNYESNLGAILLNKKHKVEEFQEEINRVKEKFEDEISQYGDDWSIITENIDEKFDWLELDFGFEDITF